MEWCFHKSVLPKTAKISVFPVTAKGYETARNVVVAKVSAFVLQSAMVESVCEGDLVLLNMSCFQFFSSGRNRLCLYNVMKSYFYFQLLEPQF